MISFLKRFDSLKSSANPENLSLTVRGLIVALIPLAIGIAAFFGVELPQPELVELADEVGTVVATLLVIYGLLRKIFYRFK